MLTENSEHRLSQLDERIRAIILEPASGSDRNALYTILQLVSKTKPAKRAAIFDHFAKKKRIVETIAKLRIVYEMIAAEAERKQTEFDQWLAGVRSTDQQRGDAAPTESFDGAPS